MEMKAELEVVVCADDFCGEVVLTFSDECIFVECWCSEVQSYVLRCCCCCSGVMVGVFGRVFIADRRCRSCFGLFGLDFSRDVVEFMATLSPVKCALCR